ncbi:MAG: thiamine phosphate synthase, partial [Planctomycetota bacterium]|nr:thiamine phosphate synthase [Planctomycetota bacterium]
VVNDRADVAAAAAADGVHLGQHDLPVEHARRVVGALALVGGSAHDLGEAGRLVAAGCDYAGVGRFARSDTKSDATEAGPDFVRAFTDAHPGLPHLVIGGVGPENIDEVIAAGGRGVAVCAAACAAADPSEVVAGLRLTLQQAVADDLEAAGDAG